MFRLLKLSETKQCEHVHLGDVSHSTHGKYDVCTFPIMLCFLFAFSLCCNMFDIFCYWYLLYSAGVLFTFYLIIILVVFVMSYYCCKPSCICSVSVIEVSFSL